MESHAVLGHNRLDALMALLWSGEGEKAVDAILAERAPGWMFDPRCPSGSVFACKRGEPYSVWMTPGWDASDEDFRSDGTVRMPVQIMRDEDAEPHPGFDDEPDHYLRLTGDASADLRVYAEALAVLCLRVEATKGPRIPHRTPECLQEDHLTTRDDELHDAGNV